jgi:hypothetical protein
MPASVHSEDAQEHDQSMMDVEAEEPVNPILLDEKRIVVVSRAVHRAMHRGVLNLRDMS